MSTPDLRPFPFDGAEVRAVVTPRRGGVSTSAYDSLNLGDHVGDDHDRVLENRRLVAAALDVRAITIADQQHRSTCAVVGPDLAGKGFEGVDESRRYLPATDALVSDVPGAALGIMVADCAPVLFWDRTHHAIGAAHAGRPGVMDDVLGSVVETMRTHYGTRPADLVVGIGPCIAFESYEVGDAEGDALEARFPGAHLTRPSRPGHQLMDVGGAVEHRLAALGVGDDRVHRMRVDTLTNTDTFFSDRAERPCGRFMAVVALPASPTTP